MSKDFVNKYDNADISADRTSKDIAAAYTAYDEMKAMKLYYEVLQLEAAMADSQDTIVTRVMKADGSMDEQKIEMYKLIPQQNEFEQARRRVIARLNDYMVNSPMRLKQLYADFETESFWDLSSKIANHIFDDTKRKRVGDEFKFY
jgi:hypothetical protein